MQRKTCRTGILLKMVWKGVDGQVTGKDNPGIANCDDTEGLTIICSCSNHLCSNAKITED